MIVSYMPVHLLERTFPESWLKARFEVRYIGSQNANTCGRVHLNIVNPKTAYKIGDIMYTSLLTGEYQYQIDAQ